MSLARTFIAAAGLAACGLASPANALQRDQDGVVRIEACTADNKTVSVGFSYQVPFSEAFEIDFEHTFQTIMRDLNADELQHDTVAYDIAFAKGWLSKMAPYYKKAPPTIYLNQNVTDGCRPGLKLAR